MNQLKRGPCGIHEGERKFSMSEKPKTALIFVFGKASLFNSSGYIAIFNLKKRF